jgi:enoyl-CoA hydratase/carnithine racemase
MRKFLAWDVKAAAWEEAYAQAASLQTNDAVEGMAALLEKRAPEFTGT